MRIKLENQSDAATASAWKPHFRPEWTPRIASFFRLHPQPFYALLDAARDPHVLGLLIVEDLRYQSLYEGPQGEELADFAPYLVEIPADAPLLDVLVRDGWGRSWGLYLTSTASFAEVRKHFRRFLLAQTPDGEEALFRFYDPRVLRVFLPQCNAEEARAFFGPVTCFLTEDETPSTVLRFTNSAKGVNREAFPLGPCVDTTADKPWVQAILREYADVSEEDRLDLLRGWKAALPRNGS